MIDDYSNYQILFFVIAVILIARTILYFFLKKKSFREVLVAISFWGGFALLGLFPRLFDYVAKLTGFSLGINALVVFSIIVIFYALARQILYNDKLEHSITQIVRKEALKDLEEYKK